MVLPNQALQTTEAGWVQQETTPISHVAMLYHRPTAELVMEYLKSMSNIESRRVPKGPLILEPGNS